MCRESANFPALCADGLTGTGGWWVVGIASATPTITMGTLRADGTSDEQAMGTVVGDIDRVR